jgi:ribitol-5-phosphate 2-dehydrogenase (NADP+)
MINTLYRLVSPKQIEIAYEEIDLNKVEVIVRPAYLSICNADQRYYQGIRDPEILSKKLPMALIHEGVGVVVYDKTLKFRSGDMVAMIPNIPIEKDPIIGENYLYSSKFRSSDVDGFLQDYLVFSADRLVKIKNDVSYKVTAFTELISVIIHAIYRFDEFSHGRNDSIGIWGDGTVAYITVVLLKHLFPDTELIVFGKNLDKLSYFTLADQIHLINRIPSDLEVEHAFECVGGQKSQKALDQIIDKIKPEGTISLLGVSEYPITINTRMILEKGLKLFGTSRSSREDFLKAVKLLEEDPEVVDYLENIVTSEIKIRSIDDIKHAFERDNEMNFGKTILIWDK